jgi:hypothetical protein
MQATSKRGRPKSKSRSTQAGQALIYGLFMLTAGLASLFFLFNVGQLTQEKTKLVNTSDAVAYSAGVMHARAMNVATYTNRALVANEMAIAQSVSLASWGDYLVAHGQSAVGLGCNAAGNGANSEPAAELMLRYLPVCASLGLSFEKGLLQTAIAPLRKVESSVTGMAEAAKEFAQAAQSVLQTSQSLMALALPVARLAVMQDVAEANYQGDGSIQVDVIGLRDTFYWFNRDPDNPLSPSPMVHRYEGPERARMRDLVVKVVNQDGFTASRNWSDTAIIPEPSCLFLGVYRNHVERTGGTQLMGFDEWRATDQATYYRWQLQTPKWSLPYCEESAQQLGTGNQRASPNGVTSATSTHWKGSGIPSFAELSTDALQDPDPRAQFAVRVLRQADQTLTSDARSDIKTTPRLNAYNNAVPTDLLTQKKVYVGLSAAETFFKRPTDRADGMQEIGSLFNPYWQTHLMQVPDSVREAAQLLQGVVTP